MNKHILLLCIAIVLSSHLFSQITFSNQTAALLEDTTVNSFYPMGIADMNGDSLDDIIRVNALLTIDYQQQDGGTFETHVFEDIHLSSPWGLCIADVDSNGYNDIFAGGLYDGLKLLKANSSGDDYVLTELTTPNIFLQGANFVDIDNNGTVDIFACHDDDLSVPFSNDGNGVFTHDLSLINAVSTVPSDNSGNYGSVWIDYDNDKDLDLYISKCRQSITNPLDGRRINLLFQNDGNNNYTDVAEAAGLRPLAQTWAADFADVDNDGDLDCFLVNHDMSSLLYSNDGDGTFSDSTSTSGMATDLASFTFGIQCIFDDFDNDGFVDLLLTSSGGHKLFRNNGDFTFSEETNPFPSNGSNIVSAVTGDLNNDGFLDVYAGLSGSAPDKLFINENVDNNYLKLLLQGDSRNINAIGARAEIYGEWGVQIREVRSGESYGIMNSFVLHFGLGTETIIDSLKITWPNGVVEKICGIAANQTLALTENDLPNLLTSAFTLDENDLEVSFTNTSEGIPDSWEWDFGDGTTSTEENPMHTFPDAGPYIVALTISNDCESNVHSITWQLNPLPLDLISFTGNLLDKGEIALRWLTENETDFSHFELQRSTDLRKVETVANIPGKNNLFQNQYGWIDRFPEDGTNYYRLKLININGTFDYSNWIQISIRPTIEALKVFPNPAKNKLTVSTGSTKIQNLLIYSATGKLILQIENQTGDFDINLTDWETGVYFLQATTAGESQFVRFSKM